MSTRGTMPPCTISRALRRWYQMSDSAMRVAARIVVTYAINRNHASSRLNGCFVDEGCLAASGVGDAVMKRGASEGTPDDQCGAPDRWPPRSEEALFQSARREHHAIQHRWRRTGSSNVLVRPSLLERRRPFHERKQDEEI